MPTPSRAHEIASIHLGGINATRKKCGLPPLAASELALEFAAVAHLPVRAKGSTLPTGENRASADSMWSGIVAKLNATLPSRAPITAGCTSPASVAAESRTDAVVDWSFGDLAKELALSTPGMAGECEISDLYDASDRRRYFIPCPHCGDFGTLKYERMLAPSAATPATIGPLWASSKTPFDYNNENGWRAIDALTARKWPTAGGGEIDVTMGHRYRRIHSSAVRPRRPSPFPARHQGRQ